MIYAFIDPHSGDLLCQNYEPIETDWYFAVPDGITANDIYIDGEGLQFYPPRPGDWAEWDHLAKEWIDPRDPAETLNQLRLEAVMSRSDFVLSVMSAGVIAMTIAEAGQAARGEIPAPFEQVISTLPPGMQLEAVVRWSGATVIERKNPVLAVLAGALDISDAQLDALFGIGVQAS